MLGTWLADFGWDNVSVTSTAFLGIGILAVNLGHRMQSRKYVMDLSKPDETQAS